MTGSTVDQLYVHAKIGIVDDRWLTIGSANLNAHSFFNDTEVNVQVADPALARATRLRLWSEHLGVPEARSPGTRRTSSTGCGGRSPGREHGRRRAGRAAHAPPSRAHARLPQARAAARADGRRRGRRLSEGCTLPAHGSHRRGDAGARAARGGPDRAGAVEGVGPVPQRAAVGHGARGLQRRTATPGRTSPTTRPARAPTAGARTASPGICDDDQRLCFALALWNGADPILKERLFGLTNAEGNHGEDVKEYYFYLDSTPTHSLPAVAVQVPAARRSRTTTWSPRTAPRSRTSSSTSCSTPGSSTTTATSTSMVEYAKAAPEDIADARSPCTTAGPDDGAAAPAADAVVPQHVVVGAARARGRRCAARRRPARRRAPSTTSSATWHAPRRRATPTLLFSENETNDERLFGAAELAAVRKDGIDRLRRARRRRRGEPGAARHQGRGPLTRSTVPAGGSATVRAAARPAAAPRRRRRSAPASTRWSTRAGAEADEFYADDHRPPRVDADAAAVMRQALAGMLWRSSTTTTTSTAGCASTARTRCGRRRRGTCATRRGSTWSTDDVISMPDKWEYPWYAAWDLAFHAVPLALVDLDFAKQQLDLLLTHALPAPERPDPGVRVELQRRQPAGARLGDAVRATSARREHRGAGDRAFLEHVVHKLLHELHLVGEPQGPRRPQRLPGRLPRPRQHRRVRPQRAAAHRRPPRAGRRHGVDGAVLPEHARRSRSSWPRDDPVYVDMALKFVEHFCWIAAAIDPRRRRRRRACGTRRTASSTTCCACPDGSGERLKVRSLVGLLPLCAATVLEPRRVERVPRAAASASRRSSTATRRSWPTLADAVGPGRQRPPPAVARRRATGCGGSWRGCSTRSEFLGPHGIRSLSRYHLDAAVRDRRRRRSATRSTYQPAESDTGMFGGNSNWRGPVWFPINAADPARAAAACTATTATSFTVECPTGSGAQMTLFEVAQEIARPADRDVPPRRRRPPARLRRAPSGSRTTRTGATCSCSTSTSTATTAPASAPATRPAGPGWSRR